MKEKSTNYLKGVSCFLSGGIDRCKDDGVGWRKELRNKCEKAYLPLIFLDPTDKPKGMGSEIGDEKLRIQKLMKEGKWEQAQSEVKIFRRYDLRMVDICNLYIIYIDIKVHYCGSYDEYNVAERQNKPLFAIMADGQSKFDVPAWLIASLNEDEVFENIDECVDHLKFLFVK
jgi:hypothetical protein